MLLLYIYNSTYISLTSKSMFSTILIPLTCWVPFFPVWLYPPSLPPHPSYVSLLFPKQFCFYFQVKIIYINVLHAYMCMYMHVYVCVLPVCIYVHCALGVFCACMFMCAATSASPVRDCDVWSPRQGKDVLKAHLIGGLISESIILLNSLINFKIFFHIVLNWTLYGGNHVLWK